MRAAITLLCLAITSCAHSEEYPQAFEYSSGEEHTSVVLYGDGHADFSERFRNVDGAIETHTARAGKWEWCNSSTMPTGEGNGCVLLRLTFTEDRQDIIHTVHYLYSKSQLREMDERGIATVLSRVDAAKHKE